MKSGLTKTEKDIEAANSDEPSSPKEPEIAIEAEEFVL